MMKARSLYAFTAFLALASVPFVATGCGPKTAPASAVKAGPMPEGEEWTGVYFNQVYGMVHILEHDGKIFGRYKWQNQSHWGQIDGTVDGNVAHFTWKEYVVGPVAPNQEKSGKGYWVYSINNDKIGALSGEFGEDDNEVGTGRWDCLKQKNVKPDPDSIKADVASDIPATQDSWDKGGGGATDPTAPSSEPAPSNSSDPPLNP
jgi:hypothetical protein